jgi:hypothetical protein
MSALIFWHDFSNTFGKIKQKLYIASGSAPPPPPDKEKFWMRLHSSYRNCKRKLRRWCNSKDNKTIHDNTNNFQATSSISYRKPTRRRHELIDRKQRRKKSALHCGLPQQTGVCMCHRQKMQHNWWFCVVHKHYVTEWKTNPNFGNRYLHRMYDGDGAITNNTWFHVSGCTNSQNNRQWSENTMIIHGVLLHDEWKLVCGVLWVQVGLLNPLLLRPHIDSDI